MRFICVCTVVADVFVYAYRQMLRRSSMHLGRNIAGSVGSYLPEALTEIWEPARDFASLKLPSAGVHSIVALSK
jgi:autophagy-related protein 18